MAFDYVAADVGASNLTTCRRDFDCACDERALLLFSRQTPVVPTFFFVHGSRRR